MTKPVRTLLALVALSAVPAVLGGCPSTQESRFYLLEPLADPQAPPAGSAGLKPLAVSIRLVLAEYLDRTEIVTRAGANRYELAEYDCWAEPLKDNLTRVLAANLSALLGTNRIHAEDSPVNVEEGHRLEVEVTRFDGEPGGTVTLTARWRILGPDDKAVLAVRASRIDEPIQGQALDAMVAAHNRAWAAFSKEVAAAIQGLADRPPDGVRP